MTLFADAHTTTAEKLAVHARLRGLLMGLPPDAMLLSVCELLDPMDTIVNMVDGVDLFTHGAWSDACEATANWLGQVDLYRRRYYLAAALPTGRRAWRELLRDASADVTSTFGIGARPISDDEVELRRRQAREMEARLGTSVPLTAVGAGELCWLYARALCREADEPSLDATWEPPPTQPPRGPRRRRPTSGGGRGGSSPT